MSTAIDFGRGLVWLAISATILPWSSVEAAIYDSRFIDVGGIQQWIQIRGENEHNSVLL